MLLTGALPLLRAAASALGRADGAPVLGDGPWLRWYSACSATAQHVNKACTPPAHMLGQTHKLPLSSPKKTFPAWVLSKVRRLPLRRRGKKRKYAGSVNS